VVHRGPAWRDVLRRRTREAHDALDRALTGPTGRVASSEDYLRVLHTLHALHAGSEERLRRWVDGSPLAAGIAGDVELPDRAALYAGDLLALGEPVPHEPDPTGSDHPVDDAEGIALLYLLSGSSAGARVLLHGLPEDVPRAARRGLTDAAGPGSARLWQAVRGLLAAPAEEPLASRAADEADALFGRLLAHVEERAA